MNIESNGGSFLVRILDTQNATWQGTVIWTEEDRTVSFRSALELIRLLDSAVHQTANEDTT